MDTKKEDIDVKTAPEAPAMPAPGEPGPGRSAVPLEPLHGPVDSKLFPLRKLRGAWPEGSGPAWGKGTEGRYPFCASWRYGGVGAGALPLGFMRYKHDGEDN